MMTPSTAVTAQGAVTVNRPAMSVFFVAAFGKIALSRTSKLAFVLFIVLASSAIHSFAQNSDTLDASTFNLEVQAESGFIAPGETATLVIALGDENNQVNQATEFDITLEIDQDVDLSIAPEFSFSDSWFIQSSSPDITISIDTTNQAIRIQAQESSPQSGYGNLFAISLTAGENGIFADQFVKNLGGIIMVDDIGYKTTEISPKVDGGFSPTIFPNPFSHSLNFNWNGHFPSTVIIFDNSGNQIATLHPDQIDYGQWSPSNLKPGMYHILISYPDGSSINRSVIKI